MSTIVWVQKFVEPTPSSLLTQMSSSNMDFLRGVRVRPFYLKIVFAYKWNKAKLDPFHMCFAISLYNFTSLFCFFSLLFASLHFSNFRFKVKQSEAKFMSIFLLFFTFFTFFPFLLLFTFFAFFALNFLLCFDLVIFASKGSKIQVYFLVFSTFFFAFYAFFAFFWFFAFFSFFRLIFISLWFFA